jgi:cystathionine beta-synthase
MPVVRAEPPIMAAEMAGAVSERALLEGLYTGAAKLADRVEQHMEDMLPTIGSGEPIANAVAALERADAVVVQEDGSPVGVLTRVDLLEYIAGSRSTDA